MSDTINDMPTVIDQQQRRRSSSSSPGRRGGTRWPGQLIDIVARNDLAAGPQPRGA